MKISQTIFDVMRPMPPFIPELRQANRDGRKSQTRRVVKPQPKFGLKKGILDAHWYDTDEDFAAHVGDFIKCKYGKVGDIVYMREPLVEGEGGYAFYKDDGAPVLHAYTGFHVQWEWKVKTLSQLYMPKFAARSIFQYEFIRVERLKDMSEKDALAEGVILNTGTGYFEVVLPESHAASHVACNSAVGAYMVLWDELNLKRGFGWNVNPWVWVLGYKPLVVKHGG